MWKSVSFFSAAEVPARVRGRDPDQNNPTPNPGWISLAARCVCAWTNFKVNWALAYSVVNQAGSSVIFDTSEAQIIADEETKNNITHSVSS